MTNHLIMFLCVVIGLVLMVLGIICLISPNMLLRLDKAFAREITRLDRLSLPYRIIMGAGLIWIGFFIATLPRFLRCL